MRVEGWPNLQKSIEVRSILWRHFQHRYIHLKITVITAVYNRPGTVGQAIDSVANQSFPDVEHLIIDGASSDATIMEIERHRHSSMIVYSEPDEGIYDALNKGVKRASGDIVGVMHSDDVFAHDDVLTRVSQAFSDHNLDAVYGDLQYVSAGDGDKVIRHWVSGPYSPAKLRRGWMPPHPTMYLRREVFDKFGAYDTSYRIAADYDAFLRWFGRGKLQMGYIPEVLVKMRVGGESNRSLGRILHKSREDYGALCANNIGGLGTLALKNLRKVSQFFVR